MHENETLILSYFCTFLSMALIVTRMVCRRIRHERFKYDDWWMAGSMIPLWIRMGTIHMVLSYGQNDGKFGGRPFDQVPADEIRRRTMGAQGVLASRVFYAAFLWCMKACILGFYARLTSGSKRYAFAVNVTWVILFFTFIGTFLSTILECNPMSGYWTIVANPPKCAKAMGQLIVMGVCNIFTDLILIVMPLPLIFKSDLPLIRKIQVILLFCVGFFVVSITLIRLPIIVDNQMMQRARSMWASIECFASCVVANAPVLNTFIQDFRRKRRPVRRQAIDGTAGDSCAGPIPKIPSYKSKKPPAMVLYSPTYKLEETPIRSTPGSRKSSIVPGEEFIEEDGDFTRTLPSTPLHPPPPRQAWSDKFASISTDDIDLEMDDPPRDAPGGKKH